MMWVDRKLEHGRQEDGWNVEGTSQSQVMAARGLGWGNLGIMIVNTSSFLIK